MVINKTINNANKRDFEENIFKKTIFSHSIVLTSFMMHKKFEMQQIFLCSSHYMCKSLEQKGSNVN